MKPFILTIVYSFLFVGISFSQNRGINDLQRIIDIFVEEDIASAEAAKLRGQQLINSKLEWEFNNLLEARQARYNHIQSLNDFQHNVIMEFTEYGYYESNLQFRPDLSKSFDMTLNGSIEYLDKEINEFQNHLREIELKLTLIKFGNNAAKSLDPQTFLAYRDIFDNRKNFTSKEEYIKARYSFINNLYPFLKNDSELIKIFSLGFDKHADNFSNVMRMRNILSREEND